MSEKIYRVTDFGVSADAPGLQTEALQAVFDRCREGGGTVVVHAGRCRTGGLRMWSDTTLRLESGAVLAASETCEDYPVFPVPEGVVLHTDMELIPQYYGKCPWPECRRAILSVYGGRNIAVIGEEGSCIDGLDCGDPRGGGRIPRPARVVSHERPAGGVYDPPLRQFHAPDRHLPERFVFVPRRRPGDGDVRRVGPEYADRDRRPGRLERRRTFP